ncbi:MAG TPA: HlyD family type I secretion periplasmic adaptor subunit, partial [Geminicoccaceae bacterium]|nr:HlyD family type I secretion periplasmic adaptor subunit [Geminicoccaceae bacterium]
MAAASRGGRFLPARRSRDRELAEFVRGAAAADHVRPRGLAHILLLAVTAFFVAFLAWANWATLEEVTRGEGRVIPARQVQVVQNLEGGIVAGILVREGQEVEEGQVLLRIDNIRAASDYREKQARYLALLASAVRLRAEVEGTALTFPPEVLDEAPDMAANEQALFTSRRASFRDEVAILERQVEQREQELRELKTKLAQNERSSALAAEQLAISTPLAKQRIVSKTDLLKLEREVNELKGSVEQTRLAIPRVESALREARQRIESATSSFHSDAQRELNIVLGEIAGLREVIVAGQDRVRRTEVRSPVHGTIKQLMFNTVGGVVQPGERMLEIVPLEDTLLVEAEVRPADIAFLRPGLPAMVKITAYDFARYGGLEGQVEDISADTIKNERE